MTAALTIVAILLLLLVLFLLSAIKVAREYERGIVFRKLLDTAINAQEKGSHICRPFLR